MLTNDADACDINKESKMANARTESCIRQQMSEEDSLLESSKKAHDKPREKGDDNYHIQFLKQLTQPIQKETSVTL